MFFHQSYCLHSECFRVHVQCSQILETLSYSLMNLIFHNNSHYLHLHLMSCKQDIQCVYIALLGFGISSHSIKKNVADIHLWIIKSWCIFSLPALLWALLVSGNITIITIYTSVTWGCICVFSVCVQFQTKNKQNLHNTSQIL